MAILSGLTAPNSMGNSKKIIFMDLECTVGQMDVNIKENGETTRCMVKDFSLGVTEESKGFNLDTMENILTTRNKGMENLHGPMEKNTKYLFLCQG
jgi:hypothetical protein